MKLPLLLLLIWRACAQSKPALALCAVVFFIDWRVALDFLQLFTGLNLRVGFVCRAVVASVMQGADALAR